MVNASTRQVHARLMLGLSSREILRKSIHISGFLIAFNITAFNMYMISFTISFMALIYSISELARTKGRYIPVISSITQRAVKANEAGEQVVRAPLFFAAGIVLTILIFPTQIARAAIMVLTLGDSFACISGKWLGNTPIFFNKRKKVEGSLGGFVFAIVGCSLFIDPIRSFAGAAVGMVMECIPLPIDDNIVIPLSAGTACTLVGLCLGL